MGWFSGMQQRRGPLWENCRGPLHMHATPLVAAGTSSMVCGLIMVVNAHAVYGTHMALCYHQHRGPMRKEGPLIVGCGACRWGNTEGAQCTVGTLEGQCTGLIFEA